MILYFFESRGCQNMATFTEQNPDKRFVLGGKPRGGKPPTPRSPTKFALGVLGTQLGQVFANAREMGIGATLIKDNFGWSFRISERHFGPGQNSFIRGIRKSLHGKPGNVQQAGEDALYGLPLNRQFQTEIYGASHLNQQRVPRAKESAIEQMVEERVADQGPGWVVITGDAPEGTQRISPVKNMELIEVDEGEN